MKKSFSIIEALLTVFILSVALFSIGALFAAQTSLSHYLMNRFVAVLLAQEALEIVRNIRDTNFVQDMDWRTNLPECTNSSPCQLDYLSNSLVASSTTQPLVINSNGFYAQGLGTSTKFKRIVTFPKVESDYFDAQVEVSWEEGGQHHSFKAKERFYNWKPR